MWVNSLVMDGVGVGEGGGTLEDKQKKEFAPVGEQQRDARQHLTLSTILEFSSREDRAETRTLNVGLDPECGSGY